MDRIILNGRAGSGKDLVADYLVEKYNFKKLYFAEGIYDIAYRYFGMTYKDRKLLQNIGQKMREVDSQVWINHTIRQSKEYDRVVISDCRQSNEYTIAVDSGFLPVHIHADLDIRKDRIEKRDGIPPDLSLLENESETGADDFDYIKICNNGSVEELFRQVDKLIEMSESELKNKMLEIKKNTFFKQYAGN